MSLGLAAVPSEESVSFLTFSLKNPSLSLTAGFDDITSADHGSNPLSDGLAGNHPSNELRVDAKQGRTVAKILNEIRAWQDSQEELKQLVLDVDSYSFWINDPNPHARSGVKPLLNSGSYKSYNLQSDVKMAVEFKKVNETSWLNTYGNGVTWMLTFILKVGRLKRVGSIQKAHLFMKTVRVKRKAKLKPIRQKLILAGIPWLKAITIFTFIWLRLMY